MKIDLYLPISYVPTIGAFAGLSTGIIARIWQGVPSGFKLPSKLVRPACPLINRPMQATIKGPFKYFMAFAPLGYSLVKACYESCQQKNWAPLKNQLIKYETILAISLLAFTLFFTLTHSYWLAFLPSPIADLSDFSEHVLMTFGIANILSVGIAGHQSSRVQNCAQAVFLGFGIACGLGFSILLFNTARYYHSVIEVCAATASAASLAVFSHLAAKKTALT